MIIILIAGILITLAGAVLSSVDRWKKRTEPQHKRSNAIAIISLIITVIGGGITLYSGIEAIQDKNTSEKIALIKDSENRLAHDSIEKLNVQIRSLALEQLDTSKTILKYSQELNAAYKTNMDLQKQLDNYVIGDKSVPWITTMSDFENITFTILNTSKYPLHNVRIKFQEVNQLTLGDLPPQVVNRFYTIKVPSDFKEGIFSIVVWYNNGQSVTVDVNMKRRPDNFLEQTKVSYFDRDGVEFEHPFIKHKPKNFWNHKTPGYKPDDTY